MKKLIITLLLISMVAPMCYCAEKVMGLREIYEQAYTNYAKEHHISYEQAKKHFENHKFLYIHDDEPAPAQPTVIVQPTPVYYNTVNVRNDYPMWGTVRDSHGNRYTYTSF